VATATKQNISFVSCPTGKTYRIVMIGSLTKLILVAPKTRKTTLFLVSPETPFFIALQNSQKSNFPSLYEKEDYKQPCLLERNILKLL
jgi:hypothetical protein